MRSQKPNNTNIQELNEALKFAKEVGQKIQEYDRVSEQVAEKWQRRAETKKQANK
ncbi:MAG: hypothetical protein AAFQ80_19900 [Cyanobacteria bacterium J06621_8]